MTLFSDLIGKEITNITVGENSDGDEVVFECSDGSSYKMYHRQDCCESVYLESFSAEELQRIRGKVVNAYESSYNTDTDEYGGDEEWTFYNIQTEQDSATLRWHGSSNGYYSTSVDFEEVD